MYDVRLESFKPKEAAAITGVPCGLQRSYRQRQYLSQLHGHAPFTIMGLAELAIVSTMAETTCPPDLIRRNRDWAVSGIVYQALRNEDAFDSPDISLDIDLRAFASQILPRYSALAPDLRQVIPGRFLIIWADKTCEWTASPAEITAARPAQIIGPVVVLDQQAIGAAIRERARALRRPLVHVTEKPAVPQTILQRK